MPNPQQLEELKFKLLKKGLPRKYVHRVITELSEHGEDSRHDGLMTGISDDIIGDADKLADAIFEKMKKGHFAGRHPIFSFIFLPVVTLAATVALSMIVVDFLGDLLTDADFRNSDGFAPYVYTYYCFVKYFLPISLALGFCFIAQNSFCGFRWAFITCISLTVFLLLSLVEFTPPISGSPGTGTFQIGFGFPYGTLQSDLTLQKKIKCMLEYYKGLWQFTPLLLFGIYYFFTSVKLPRTAA